MSMTVDDGQIGGSGAGGAVLSDSEVWQLPRHADLILHGVLEAQDAAARRRWQEQAQACLQGVNRA